MARSIKALRLFNHILLGLVLLALTGALWNNGSRLVKATKQWWLSRITRLMDMEIEVLGDMPERGDTGMLFVSNHISWTDIPVIGGLTQLNFLSKAEVKSWPLIGKLADSTGTLFIRRGSGDANRVSVQIADYLRAGRSVLFFPEGTSTDGTAVARFHRKLFHTCEHIETRVCPIVLHYSIAGLNHNPVAFVGDDEFSSHIWNLLLHHRIKVTVSVLPARQLKPAQLEQQVSGIRAEMAAQLALMQARQVISTSAQWPDASSRAGQQDEAASF